MAVWVVVWVVLALVTVGVVVAFALGLAKQGLIVGRTAARMAEEVGGLANDIGAQAARASDRAAGLSVRRRPGRDRA
jgi:hypothetical protein